MIGLVGGGRMASAVARGLGEPVLATDGGSGRAAALVAEVGAHAVPEQVVFNKADLADDATRLVLRGLEPTAVFASARTGEGVEVLLQTIAARLPLPRHEVTALVPFERGDLVSLVHEDSAPLRRMAVFDVVVNNADRKGGHVLAMADGHRYGVDHGVCFHTDHKLRTVLWGWATERLDEADRTDAAAVRAALRLER